MGVRAQGELFNVCINTPRGWGLSARSVPRLELGEQQARGERGLKAGQKHLGVAQTPKSVGVGHQSSLPQPQLSLLGCLGRAAAATGWVVQANPPPEPRKCLGFHSEAGKHPGYFFPPHPVCFWSCFSSLFPSRGVWGIRAPLPRPFPASPEPLCLSPASGGSPRALQCW